MVADKFSQLVHRVVRLLAFVAIAQLFNHIGKAHNAQAKCAGALNTIERLRNWRVSDIAKVVELPNCAPRGTFQAVPIPRPFGNIQECRQINTHQITHADVFSVVWQSDFGT